MAKKLIDTELTAAAALGLRWILEMADRLPIEDRDLFVQQHITLFLEYENVRENTDAEVWMDLDFIYNADGLTGLRAVVA